jgi:hypothetical protein
VKYWIMRGLASTCRRVEAPSAIHFTNFLLDNSVSSFLRLFLIVSSPSTLNALLLLAWVLESMVASSSWRTASSKALEWMLSLRVFYVYEKSILQSLSR